MKDWRKTVLRQHDSVRAAIETINDSGAQLGLVIDGHGHLMGSVTDGDIRRALLRGTSLDDPVGAVMNSNPTSLLEGASVDDALDIMRKKRIRHVPVVDAGHHLVDLFVSVDIGPRELPNEVVLMAGGLGSRLGKLTEHMPKPLLPVGSKPILETIIERFSNYGFKKFHLSVNYRAEQIVEYFGDGSERGIEIVYLRENERLGTAGALSLLQSPPTLPFFVMNADLLTKIDFPQMLRFHEEQGALATMAVRQHELQVPFGVIETTGSLVERVIEKPVYSFLVNAGIYLLDPPALDFVPVGESYDMTDLLQAMVDARHRVHTFPIHEIWIDIGHRSDLEKAHSIYSRDFVE